MYGDKASIAFKTASMDELLAFKSWIKVELNDRFDLPVSKDIGEVNIWDEWWCFLGETLYMLLHKDAENKPHDIKSLINSFWCLPVIIKEGPYTSKCGGYVAVITNDNGNRKFDIYKTEKQVKE